jgi:putative flippase GtrA
MEPVTKTEAVLSLVSGDRRQFARYLGIGIIATLADWAIFYTLISLSGVFYALALATSYSASTVLNFFLNRRYTFRNRYRRVYLQLALFVAIAIVGLGLNEVIVYGLVQLIPGGETGISLMASRVIATGIVFLWNFALNKRLTFHILR